MRWSGAVSLFETGFRRREKLELSPRDNDDGDDDGDDGEECFVFLLSLSKKSHFFFGFTYFFAGEIRSLNECFFLRRDLSGRRSEESHTSTI